jgi:dihydroorotate dehydrogenase electron transfer subunit
MPQDIATPITRNEDLGGGNFLLEFDLPVMACETQPAQFFMIGVPGTETLLRRPYSVCGLPGTFDDAPPTAMQVLYKVVGKGTGILASLHPGATIQVLGPLGQGFTLPEGGRRAVMVAGGIGSAPFPALISSLDSDAVRPQMFYGARSKNDLPLRGWFNDRTDLIISTDDGSAGHHGLVTQPLEALLGDCDTDSIHLYVCGPDPMLKAVAALALRRGVICDLALEAHMACGFGICLGCVVPTHGPDGKSDAYERVCVEGPVMRAERMAW